MDWTPLNILGHLCTCLNNSGQDISGKSGHLYFFLDKINLDGAVNSFFVTFYHFLGEHQYLIQTRHMAVCIYNLVNQ